MADNRALQGALTFVGFAVCVLAVMYFAIEYIPRVSEWTQLAALVLMSLAFAFTAVYLKATTIGEPFFGEHLRWLSPPNVLVLLAIVSAVVAEMVFLSIDSIAKPVKILVSLLVGVGIIAAVARRRGAPTTPARKGARRK